MSELAPGHPSARFPNDAEPSPGLPVSVIFLRRQGVPITRKEMAEATPITGRLMIEDAWRERRPGSRRFFREATLHPINALVKGGCLHPPLFDPVVVHVDRDGMVLHGHEVDVQEGRAVQYVQVWLVRPIAL